MNSLIFTIKIVPDVEAGRQLYGLEGLPNKDVIRAMAHLRHQQAGSETMPLHLQRIIAISLLRITSDDIVLNSPGDVDSSESELLSQFFSAISDTDSTLVSWSGSAVDLPVLHLRSLLHGVASPSYWNNINSTAPAIGGNGFYQPAKLIDLSALMAGGTVEGEETLQQLSTLTGFPAEQADTLIQDSFIKGDVAAIRRDCEHDVLRVGLLYLRFEMMCGCLASNEYEQHIDRLKRLVI